MTTAATDIFPPRAVCDISMSAVQENVRSLISRLSGGTELWAVVKANAYGHDVEYVAEAVVSAGARRLCVATLSEALHLRRMGMRVPMLVMGPLDRSGMERAAHADVDVTVLSPSMVRHACELASTTGARALRVHLKVNTGMGRWGVPLDQAIAALASLDAAVGIDVVGLMTHFATADDANDDGFFNLQLDRFVELADHARELVPGIVVHAANSAATMRSSSAHFDAVRCGIALYGLSPTQGDARADGLRPALALRSHISDIRELEVGESVGYGRAWIANERSRVALVPMGYADGVRRLLSGTAHALVNGHRLTYAGTVSMDHLSLIIPDGMSVAIGDVVTIIGADGDNEVSAEDHARWAGTINYEITCGIANEPRLQRRFDV